MITGLCKLGNVIYHGTLKLSIVIYHGTQDQSLYVEFPATVLYFYTFCTNCWCPTAMQNLESVSQKMAELLH